MILSDILLRFKIELRTLCRTLGITTYLASIQDCIDRLRGKASYEFDFEKELRTILRTSDIVWDVGANVGLYTKKFSEWVGASGLVCAFEPVPACFTALQENCSFKKNVEFFNVALGKTENILPMNMANDPLGVSHSLAVSATDKGKTIEVNVTSGDYIIHSMQSPIPNVIKIDVEGFEEEVLLGLRSCLQNTKCRAIVCEIHFTVLKNRGEKLAPIRIQNMLQDAGFKIKWIDVSHLSAYR